MASYLPDYEYAAYSDVGLRRLANEDAYHCDERLGLFVVCDGIGGQPSGEAASQIISHCLSHQIRRRLRRERSIQPGLLQRVLVDAVESIGQQLYVQAESIPVLQGMGATLVAAWIDARSAFIVHAGDSRAYLLRDNLFTPLTKDHTRSYRAYVNETHLTDKQADMKERRLLQSFLGGDGSTKAEVTQVPLKPGDRLLLCSDGLTDPTDEVDLGRILAVRDNALNTCRRLIECANAGGGPDNITTIVIDYKGVRPYQPPPRQTTPPIDRSRQIVATWFHKNLERIEQTLRWLRDGADEATAEEPLRAMASVKRRLGAAVFREFLNMNPSQNPPHVFHRAAASPVSEWRKQYSQIMTDLEPNFRDITDGSVRLSPILTGEETGHIIATLWHDWRAVEKRYFNVCNREAISESEQTLTILIDHMVASVRTLIGLLEFFPRFLPPVPEPGKDADADASDEQVESEENHNASADSAAPV